MGKRITQQARGKGSLTFRVRRRAYRFKITYPSLGAEGEGQITKFIDSAGHSAPLAKIVIGKESFIIPAINGVYEGQKIQIGGTVEIGKIENGMILRLKKIPAGTRVSNIEKVPGKGPEFMRTSGSSALISRNIKDAKEIEITINRRRINLNSDCRASVGLVAGDGRLMKPLIKAGKRHHMMLAKGRKWHRTSPIKVNAVDHPFGSGRGKRIKSKIAKRNSPPGRKVGHLSPKQTGKRK